MSTSSSSSQTSSQLPSILMRHFRKVLKDTQDPGKPEEYIIHCNYCLQKYLHNRGGGYGSLHRHMIKNHPIEYRR